MNLVCKTIPYKNMRYPTCGDYWIDADGTFQIRIAELPDWRYVALVFVHEFWEMCACIHAGIEFESIDNFDKAFELHRQPGNTDEPGDDSAAPYYNQHQSACAVERLFAFILGVRWEKYADAIEALE
jgi:hypothetical protein